MVDGWQKMASGLYVPAPKPERAAAPPPKKPECVCQGCGAALPGTPLAQCGPSAQSFRHSFVCGHETAYSCRACVEAERFAKCSVCGETAEYT